MTARADVQSEAYCPGGQSRRPPPAWQDIGAAQVDRSTVLRRAGAALMAEQRLFTLSEPRLLTAAESRHRFEASRKVASAVTPVRHETSGGQRHSTSSWRRQWPGTLNSSRPLTVSINGRPAAVSATTLADPTCSRLPWWSISGGGRGAVMPPYDATCQADAPDQRRYSPVPP